MTDEMTEAGPARRLWQLVEPYHALTYFAPESHQAYVDAGLRGFWRGYFAGRAAPLGEVGAAVVTASFYGFHPDFVARALPSVWTMVSPTGALEARLAGIDGAVGRLLGPDADAAHFARPAELLRRALDGASVAGRPLFAANAELSWPGLPHLDLWQAATLLREHRGDGHVAALLTAGLDPCEAHVSQVAASGVSLDTIKPYRGWSDDDWQAAGERLRSRGWLDADDQLTSAGWKVRRQVEDDTDQLAVDPVERLGAAGAEELFGLLGPLTGRLVETETIPYPNPIGVPPPGS